MNTIIDWLGYTGHLIILINDTIKQIDFKWKFALYQLEIIITLII